MVFTADLFFANLAVFALHIPLRKHVFFAMLCNVEKNLFNEAHSRGISRNLIAVPLPMLKRLSAFVVFAKIRARRRKLVANAFNGVFIRHERLDCAIGVCPIFNMVLISPLVMKPGATVTRRSSANTYR